MKHRLGDEAGTPAAGFEAVDCLPGVLRVGRDFPGEEPRGPAAFEPRGVAASHPLPADAQRRVLQDNALLT